jgi:hypothetical protein
LKFEVTPIKRDAKQQKTFGEGVPNKKCAVTSNGLPDSTAVKLKFQEPPSGMTVLFVTENARYQSPACTPFVNMEKPKTPELKGVGVVNDVPTGPREHCET